MLLDARHPARALRLLHGDDAAREVAAASRTSGLALDPEWRVQEGEVPGQVIGTVDAREVNATSAWLAQLVDEHDLPQKLFIVHQFTEGMVDDAALQARATQLAMVLNADGFGSARGEEARSTTRSRRPPRTFDQGFKLFYKEDEGADGPGAGAGAEAAAGRRGVRVGDAAVARCCSPRSAGAQVAYGQVPGRRGAGGDACARRADVGDLGGRGGRGARAAARRAGRSRRRARSASAPSCSACTPGGRSAPTPTPASSGRASAACRCWRPRRGR